MIRREKSAHAIAAGRQGRLLWPGILLLAGLSCGCMLVYSLFRLRGRMTEFARPRSSVASVIDGAVWELKRECKLAVLTVAVTGDVRKSSTKYLYGIDLGTTTVWVKAYGRVQYVVPLEAVSAESFHYDAQERRLHVTLPPPRLDRDMVAVDPARIVVMKEIGWARLNRYSGRYLEARAKEELVSELIRAGSHELLRAKACDQARLAVGRLLGPAIDRLQNGTVLELQFAPIEPDG